MKPRFAAARNARIGAAVPGRVTRRATRQPAQDPGRAGRGGRGGG
jgi:hypothetical protein